MKNYMNREIPDELLKDGKEVYKGKAYRDGKYYIKSAPRVKIYEKNRMSKVAKDLNDALIMCGIRDGLTIAFHHHFREGDFVVNQVVEAIVDMGYGDITIAASSLGAAHDPIAKYITKGIVTGIQSSGIRGRIGEAISAGYLKKPAIIRSHGGRVRAIEEGEVHIDIAFIGASTSDEFGNARGKGGKSDCGGLSYSMVDAKYADHVVVITDTLVPFPNFPPSIEAIDVDCVVVVDKVGNPKKIAGEAVRFTTDPRDLLMARRCAEVMAATPYFADGYSFQTGAGGPSLAVNRYLEPLMHDRNIKMGWAIGGISHPIVDLLKRGLIGTVVDAQGFDVSAIESINTTPNHYEISTSQYANPANKGAFVSQLDFVVLAALEVDVNFNVNVLTGSDGVLRGAPGGHPDAAAGSKCCIIVTPLIRGRMATICKQVVTITTPGDCVDIVITDHGIAVNPLRKDIMQWLDEAGIPHRPISELQAEAYALVGEPDDLQWENKIVAILEARDGTILDVIRKIKPVI